MIGPDVTYRAATSRDASAMMSAHGSDAVDGRIAAYLDGRHHPQQALGPRTAFVALVDDLVVGYAAAHLTTRNGCAGEVQYLFVNPAYRRRGIGSELLRRLAGWLTTQGARRVCVPLANDSPPEAKPFLERAGAGPIRQRFWYGWDDITMTLSHETPKTRNTPDR